MVAQAFLPVLFLFIDRTGHYLYRSFPGLERYSAMASLSEIHSLRRASHVRWRRSTYVPNSSQLGIGLRWLISAKYFLSGCDQSTSARRRRSDSLCAHRSQSPVASAHREIPARGGTDGRGKIR